MCWPHLMWETQRGGDSRGHGGRQGGAVEVTDVHLLQGTCSCASKGFSIRCPACAEAVTPEQVLDGKDSSRLYLGPGLQSSPGIVGVSSCRAFQWEKREQSLCFSSSWSCGCSSSPLSFCLLLHSQRKLKSWAYRPSPFNEEPSLCLLLALAHTKPAFLGSACLDPSHCPQYLERTSSKGASWSPVSLGDAQPSQWPSPESQDTRCRCQICGLMHSPVTLPDFLSVS